MENTNNLLKLPKTSDLEIEIRHSQASSRHGTICSHKALAIFNFSHATRAGDGSDPFNRYEYCFKEYLQAIASIVDSEGNVQVDINIHALNACITTYGNNMTVMHKILTDMNTTLT